MSGSYRVLMGHSQSIYTRGVLILREGDLVVGSSVCLEVCYLPKWWVCLSIPRVCRETLVVLKHTHTHWVNAVDSSSYVTVKPRIDQSCRVWLSPPWRLFTCQARLLYSIFFIYLMCEPFSFRVNLVLINILDNCLYGGVYVLYLNE